MQQHSCSTCIQNIYLSGYIPELLLFLKISAIKKATEPRHTRGPELVRCHYFENLTVDIMYVISASQFNPGFHHHEFITHSNKSNKTCSISGEGMAYLSEHLVQFASIYSHVFCMGITFYLLFAFISRVAVGLCFGERRAGICLIFVNAIAHSALSFWPINIIFGRKHYYTIIQSEFEIQINLLFFSCKIMVGFFYRKSTYFENYTFL